MSKPKERLQPENTLISWFVNEYAEIRNLENTSIFATLVYFKAHNLLKAAHFLSGMQSLIHARHIQDRELQERSTENIANLEEIALRLIRDHGEDADTLDFSIEDIRAILVDAFGGRISDETIEK